MRKAARRESASVVVNDLRRRRSAAEAQLTPNMVEAINPSVAMLLPMAKIPTSKTSVFQPCDQTFRRGDMSTSWVPGNQSCDLTAYRSLGRFQYACPEICARGPSFGRSFPELVGETSVETYLWPIEHSGARSAKLAQPTNVEQISHYLTVSVRQHLEYGSSISAALFRLPAHIPAVLAALCCSAIPAMRSPNIPQPSCASGRAARSL